MIDIDDDEVVSLMVNALIKLNIFRFALCDIEQAPEYLETAMRCITKAIKLKVEQDAEAGGGAEFDDEIETWPAPMPPKPEEPSI